MYVFINVNLDSSVLYTAQRIIYNGRSLDAEVFFFCFAIEILRDANVLGRTIYGVFRKNFAHLSTVQVQSAKLQVRKTIILKITKY